MELLPGSSSYSAVAVKRTQQTGASPHCQPTTTTTATAFGLDIQSDAHLPFLDGAARAQTGRTLSITVDGEHPHCWPADATPISDEHERDGTICHRTEADPALGYRLWGPRYGSHLLSPSGEHLRIDPEAALPGAWQRLLIAQVLPFAALLQGLEVLHASAVVMRPGAVGLLGPSGSGKTTLACELCQRGAIFLADDVLAVEPHGRSLLAHPGAPVLGVNHREARRRTELGTNVAQMPIDVNQRERMLRVQGIGEPTPLTALFLLDRRPDGPAEPIFNAAVDPRTLLATTFNFVLDAPERLLRLLEACVLLAQGRVERVLAGPRVAPAALAEAIAKRLEHN